MKGIILAGGKGTRLYPITRCCNKHLLPVGRKPMAQHCVEKLTEAGINDILIVTGGEHIGGIAEFFGGGKDFGCRFTYRVQEEAGGIAQALGLAEGFVSKGEHMCVILGDNMFEDSLKSHVDWFDNPDNEPLCEGMVLLSSVSDPGRFGVAEVMALLDPTVWINETVYHRPIHGFNEYCRWSHDKGTRFIVEDIEEKPTSPKTTWAVTGVYFYTPIVFDVIRDLKPSGRGELEITDVNNYFVRNNLMACRFWKGWWTDAGTHESYFLANELMKRGVAECP